MEIIVVEGKFAYNAMVAKASSKSFRASSKVGYLSKMMLFSLYFGFDSIRLLITDG